jgi:DNA polymerase-3 subunit gamma/tau
LSASTERVKIDSSDSVLPAGKTKIRTVPRTPQLTSFLKADARNGDAVAYAPEEQLTARFTQEQLRDAWSAFAGQRKKFQAEYQLLSQPYNIEGSMIVVDLLSPVHETMLNNIKIELTTFLREQVRNSSIQVTGKLREEGQEQRIIYTNREKFDFLAEKNPLLKELKDRLGLDTDF